MITQKDITYSVCVSHELGKDIVIIVTGEYKQLSESFNTEVISDNDFELLEVVNRLKKQCLEKINSILETN